MINDDLLKRMHQTRNESEMVKVPVFESVLLRDEKLIGRTKNGEEIIIKEED